jgi:hypothetical protein
MTHTNLYCRHLHRFQILITRLLNRVHLSPLALQSVKLTWPSLCISNAAADNRCLHQLVYRAYAIELALKFLMTAGIQGHLRLAPLPCTSVYTTIHKVLPENVPANDFAATACQSTLVWTPDDWALGTVAYSTASWMAERPA